MTALHLKSGGSGKRLRNSLLPASRLFLENNSHMEILFDCNGSFSDEIYVNAAETLHNCVVL